MALRKKIAVIGAGIAGLAAAKQLSTHYDVSVFEKSRGVGGRLATRYVDSFEFDHGAQYFTAKTPLFKQLVNELELAGVIQRWDARFVEIEGRRITSRRAWDNQYPHYVGVSKMNSIGKYLARECDVRLNQRVISLLPHTLGWQLHVENQDVTDVFDWVILAIPPLQALELMPANTPLHSRLSAAKMQACYSLMLGFNDALELDWDAAFIKESCLSWISINSKKPGRATELPTLVALSSNDWAQNHLDDTKQLVQETLIQEVSELLGQVFKQPTQQIIHLWRYANCGINESLESLVDFELNIALCGDWTEQCRVESAYLSGVCVANKLD